RLRRRDRRFRLPPLEDRQGHAARSAPGRALPRATRERRARLRRPGAGPGAGLIAAAGFAPAIAAAFRQRATWMQLVKFGLVGGSGYLINLAVFDLLTELLGAPHALAAVGAFAVAVTNNFLWNRRWTFAANAGPAGFQAARFFVVSIASLGLN